MGDSYAANDRLHALFGTQSALYVGEGWGQKIPRNVKIRK